MKTIVSILLLCGVILTAASSNEAVSEPSKILSREQAIKAVSCLRMGMRLADVYNSLAPYGLSSAGIMGMGSGFGYSTSYPLSDGASVTLTFRSKDQVFESEAAANDNAVKISGVSFLASGV